MTVTFKVAKLATEKGFRFSEINNTSFKYVYTQDGERYWNLGVPLIKADMERYLAPTQTDLQRWLLEHHQLFVTVDLAYDTWGQYAALIYKPNDTEEPKKNKSLILADIVVDGTSIYRTFEAAMEEGLEEALNTI